MRLNSSVVVLAAASILLAATSVAAQSNAETRADVFDAVVKTVSEQFYDPAFHGVDWEAVHTRYRTRLDQVADDADLQRLIGQMLDELKSSHLYLARTVPGVSGITLGARIEPVDGADTVLELAPLSDARAKGLRPGDRLVGGVAALKGPAGSLADVTVQRCDGTTARLKIRRERWLFPEEHPGVRWARIRVATDKVIGYIRADRFDNGAAELADQAMAELGQTQGLVIDIRTNSGGNISAMRLASYFVDSGGPAFALLSRSYLQSLGRPLTAADIAAAPKVIGRYRGEDVAEALSKGGGAALFHIELAPETRADLCAGRDRGAERALAILGAG